MGTVLRSVATQSKLCRMSNVRTEEKAVSRDLSPAETPALQGAGPLRVE